MRRNGVHQPSLSSLNSNFVLENCWTSIIHALLMRFVWKATYLESIIAFAIMRPIHSSYLLAFALTHALLDPHDFALVVLAVRDLSKAMAALVSYVGTLTAIWSCHILFWHVVPLFWRYITVQLALLAAILVSRILFWDGTKLVAAFLLSLVRKLYEIPVSLLSSTPAQLVKHHGIVLASNLTSLLHTMATTWLLRPLLGPPPSELPPFTHSPIDASKQIRLLEIQPRVPFTTPASRLVVHDLDNLPLFEAVSFVHPSSPTESTQLNIDHRQYPTSTNTRDAIRRLSCLFQPRLVWIDEICINRQHQLEASQETTHWETAFKNAFRIQVCLGKTPHASNAVAFMNALTGISWSSGLDAAVGYYERVCCATRSVIEEGLMAGFLEFLNHGWFEDAERVEKVVECRQVTFLYGNLRLTADYLAYIGDILARAEVGFSKTAVERAGEGLRWPLPGLEALIGLSRSRQVLENVGDMENL